MTSCEFICVGCICGLARGQSRMMEHHSCFVWTLWRGGGTEGLVQPHASTHEPLAHISAPLSTLFADCGGSGELATTVFPWPDQDPQESGLNSHLSARIDSSHNSLLKSNPFSFSFSFLGHINSASLVSYHQSSWSGT